MEATYSSVSLVDAFWTLFMSQSKKARKEFVDRVMAAEANIITPSLAKKIAKAEKDYNEGKTIHFDSVEELDSYLEKL